MLDGRVVLTGAALVVVALAIGGVLLLRSAPDLERGSPARWDKPAEVDGDVVRLTYGGSACQKDAWVDVDEGDDEVVLTVRTEADAGSCVDLLVCHEIEVRLDEPLGERRLVDGAKAQPFDRGRNLCAGARTSGR